MADKLRRGQQPCWAGLRWWRSARRWRTPILTPLEVVVVVVAISIKLCLDKCVIVDGEEVNRKKDQESSFPVLRVWVKCVVIAIGAQHPARVVRSVRAYSFPSRSTHRGLKARGPKPEGSFRSPAPSSRARDLRKRVPLAHGPPRLPPAKPCTRSRSPVRRPVPSAATKQTELNGVIIMNRGMYKQNGSAVGESSQSRVSGAQIVTWRVREYFEMIHQAWITPGIQPRIVRRMLIQNCTTR